MPAYGGDTLGTIEKSRYIPYVLLVSDCAVYTYRVNIKWGYETENEEIYTRLPRKKKTVWWVENPWPDIKYTARARGVL